ncbi:hypothetical protein JKF63_05508 [Porcisia hertigi]|uniref:MSP domain-containing protein n=1 Tax=Porcisia hertigi TaxID=2761500 RepID=A0A836LF74_9TRYP|nr:hypothetical protein JKF63_05508 [Porcisia hertigi]
MSHKESIQSSHNRCLTGDRSTPTPSSAHHSPLRGQQQHRFPTTHPKIKIEPNSLVFPPPHFGRCIQNAISIYNVSKRPCVFKMRSQNPERYVVKPHVAIVAPESATRSFVTLRDMNTLGLKNLPEDTEDRFRLSLKLYDPDTVDPSLSPKDLWNVLMARGAQVDHEQDLIAYFTKMETPVGGLVIFFPPTYIPVISPPVSTTPSAQSSLTRAAGSPGDNSDGDAIGKKSKAGGVAGDDAAASSSVGSRLVKQFVEGVTRRSDLWICVIVVGVAVLYASVIASRIWGSGDEATS